MMLDRIGLLGFGEAGQAFAAGLRADLRGYDRKTANPATAAAKRDDYARADVRGCRDAASALFKADAVLSVVTADQALAAAVASAPLLAAGTFWFDMNSVAPDTKRAARRAIEAAGGRYVDVAVMAPVLPARTAVPLLLSGGDAEEGAEALRRLGFSNVRTVGGEVGRASSIKMIRSVVVKGIEALSAECVLAADRADVLDEVMESLDASPPPALWADRANYNLDRMMVHGLRRAAEMEEVVKTLDALGTGSVATAATGAVQRAIGSLLLSNPPATLPAKLEMVNRKARAA